nr:systemin receptor SR160 [Ipomoea batatas]
MACELWLKSTSLSHSNWNAHAAVTLPLFSPFSSLHITVSLWSTAVSVCLCSLQVMEASRAEETLREAIITKAFFAVFFLCTHSLFSLSSSSSFPNFTCCSSFSNELFTQSQQLLSFKAGLSTKDSLHNWVSSTDPCSFTGVTCKDSRISSIDLSNTILSVDFSAISYHFLSLPNLESLVLKNSNLSGSLASASKSQCGVSLTHIDLAENTISGPISDIYSLGGCSSLRSLNLSKNSMDPPPEKEHRGAASAIKLQILDLSYNNLSGRNVIPWLLSKDFAELELLSLKGNKISGNIPELGFKNLSYLDLSANNFSTPFPSFQDCSNLEHLDLSSNKFNGEIGASLSSCEKLSFLNLTNNKFAGAIPKLSSGSMRYLYLRGNGFQGAFPAHIGELCKTLVELDLAMNDFSGVVPESIEACSVLERIDISNNNFSGSIPEGFEQLFTTASRGNPSGTNLGNNSITGNIPAELGDCGSLLWLDLNTNLLNGSIPPSLSKQSGYIAVSLLTGKRFNYIKNVGSKQCHGAGNLLEFGGIRQDRMDRISARSPCHFSRLYEGITQPNFNHNGSMIFLDLSYNKLEGSIPKELGSMYYLFILNLGHNDLSGPIPPDLGGLKTLAILDMSHNHLSGTIPQSLTSLTVGEIDLSNNNLSGMIPQSALFDTFSDYMFANNSGLCGYPLPQCGSPSSLSTNQHRNSHHLKQPSFIGTVAIGLLLSLFCISGLIIVAVETRKRRKKNEATLETHTGDPSYSITANTGWKLTSMREALSINLATFEKPLKKLTFADLLEATNGFHNDSLVGSGGCGDVYKAQLKDGSVVAIKKLIHISGQGDREFTAEMETIGKIKHRNLVPLLGYCKNKMKIRDVFDPELIKEDPSLENELVLHLKVAFDCLDDRPWKRPTMAQVMAKFKEIQTRIGGIDDSSSTIATKDGGLSADEGVEMSIRESIMEGNEHSGL